MKKALGGPAPARSLESRRVRITRSQRHETRMSLLSHETTWDMALVTLVTLLVVLVLVLV